MTLFEMICCISFFTMFMRWVFGYVYYDYGSFMTKSIAM
jgi:hypothetical protein